MNRRVFVVDTNVLVAGVITSRPDAPTARLVDAMLEGRIIYLLSPELLREYEQVLLRPAIARLHGLSSPGIETILTEITANAIWREPLADTKHSAPDAKDSHIWALLANEAQAILITGDKPLIDNPRPGSSVITPATWVDHFD
ncbi:putative toxin-antitoxin system toxin component, PIN family [Desulfonatronospira sp.]|uniref:putative toxin-antitoxin system toxin component, PIN family n=1 Tax=Desulfonatronospira sp. TaxID=1962951 RepID=UPI0025B95136|nr:putative toxin-antitoxin system toxin component, PIN family [Desulfonatronospira sp.]